jgi:hypothetical protein
MDDKLYSGEITLCPDGGFGDSEPKNMMKYLDNICKYLSKK